MGFEMERRRLKVAVNESVIITGYWVLADVRHLAVEIVSERSCVKGTNQNQYSPLRLIAPRVGELRERIVGERPVLGKHDFVQR